MWYVIIRVWTSCAAIQLDLRRSWDDDAWTPLHQQRVLSRITREERRLPTVAVLASCAPLLGLLGTVMGMIETFDVITISGTGEPTALSRGIARALVTTQTGLLVALPGLFAHARLSHRLRILLRQLPPEGSERMV